MIARQNYGCSGPNKRQNCRRSGVDAENRKKAGDNFYKMDKESIVTIREELSDDFFSLAESHLGAVRRLVERLDDDQLDTQLQFERYEGECRK